MTARNGPAIHLDGLTKEFDGTVAVESLSFDIDPGGVIGFLGPNGAGKSTTIRMLLGLIRPTSGTARVFGESVTNPRAYMHRIGALVEAPVFYPKLTGHENLAAFAALQGVDRNRIPAVLELVGLDGRGGDRAGDYSLGMKQRLAIGAALLRDPDLLILDEPTNGLDPAGIVEIRRLLMRLGAEGKTVLVSSHLLAEIQAACDRLIVIKRGNLVFEGATRDLLAQAKNEVVVVPEHADDTARLTKVLTAAGHSPDVLTDHVAITGDGVPTAAINRIAFDEGITLRELHAKKEDLEDVFLRLTTEGSLA